MVDGSKSTLSRISGVAAGVLITILGVACFFTPLEVFGVTGWLIALALIVDGVAKIMVWNDYRKIGVTDTWAFVGGVFSILIGVIMVGSIAVRAAVDVFVAYMVAFWLLFAGVVRIVRSFQMRKAQKTLNTMLGTNWGLVLIVGTIMTVLGIFCVFNPIIVMVTIGWEIGFAFIAGGIGLIVATL